MDLVAGLRRVLVITDHVTRDGEHKLLQHCSYPLTGAGVVQRIYTDIAVIDVTPLGFVLREVAPGLSATQVQALTGAPLEVDPALCKIQASVL